MRVKAPATISRNSLVKNLPAMWEIQVWSPGREDPLEKGMASHSSMLAWRIPWTEEPGRLQSMGSQRVRQDWATNIFTFHFHYRSILGSQKNWGYIKSSHISHAPPCTINLPDQSGTFVTINEHASTHHNHPKSIICTQIQSWCHPFSECWQIQNEV